MRKLCVCALRSVFILCILAAPALRAQEASDVVYTVDVGKLFENEKAYTQKEQINIIYALTSLQGLVNREKPTLYLFALRNLIRKEVYAKYSDQGFAQEEENVDKFWWDWMLKKGYVKAENVKKLNTLAEIFAVFADRYKGFLVWSCAIPANSNVCASIAGAEDMVAFSKDCDGGKLLEKMKPFSEGKTNRDAAAMRLVRGKQNHNSLKLAAYIFLKKNYIDTGKLNPFCLGFSSDFQPYLKEDATHEPPSCSGAFSTSLQNDGLFNYDYYVAKKSTVIDLCPSAAFAPRNDAEQTVGGDFEVLNDILESSYKLRKGEFGVLCGFVPWWLKYTRRTGDLLDDVEAENSLTSLLTSYNIANDADAAFGLANASFFMHLPKPAKERFNTKPEDVYAVRPEAGILYISFFMLDNDSSAWLNQSALAIYGAKGRGRIPLNWPINPILADRVPHAFEYMLDNKTSLDFFGMANDGAGYIQPYFLNGSKRVGRIKTDGFAEYIKFAKKYYKSQDISITAFYISPKFEENWAAAVAPASPFGLGVSMHVNPLLVVCDTPVSSVKSYHHSELEKFKKYINGLFESSQKNPRYKPAFKALRCILIPPFEVADAVEEARKKYPDAKVKVIDAHTYFALMFSASLRAYPQSPYAKAESVSWSAEDSSGLAPVENEDGDFETEGVYCVSKANPKAFMVRYVYFDADEDFAEKIKGKNMKLTIELEGFIMTEISVEYNSASSAYSLAQEAQAPIDRRKIPSAATKSPFENLPGGGISPNPDSFGGGSAPKKSPAYESRPQKLVFNLTDVSFSGRQNADADLRLVIKGISTVKIKSVILEIN